MPLARNPDTGETLFLDQGGQWAPAQKAVNPQTKEELFFDGKDWIAPPVDVMREIVAVGSGGNRGIARTLGAPVDLANTAINLVPGAREGITAADRWLNENIPLTQYFPKAGTGGSESIEKGMVALGATDPNMRPQTAFGRVAKRAVEEGTAAGMTMGAARGLTAAADAGRVALGPTGRTVAQTFGADPGAQLVASGGAGTGAGIANELAPGSVGAEIAGGLAGGLVGAGITPAMKYLYEGGKAFLEPLTQGGREAIVGRTLTGLATNADDLAQGAGRAPVLPGSTPTTAQALNDPGLAATERALRNNPETAAAFSQRDIANNAARTEAFNAAIPQASAGATQRAVQSQVDDHARAMGEAVDIARRNVERRLGALGPGINETQAGRVIREEYDDALGTMRQQVRRAYQAIDPQGTSSIPTATIHDEAVRIGSEYFGGSTDGVPRQLVNIFQRLRGGDQTFKAIDDMAKEASNVASMADRAGDNRTASAARQIADAIRGGLDDAAATRSGFTPEQVQAYQVARDLRRQMGQQFEQGNVGRVGATKAFGEPVLTESEIPAQFFHSSKGAPDDAAQFIASLGGRPKATQALQEYVIGDLQKSVVDETGQVNAGRLRSWLSRHAPALREFPDIQTRVRNVQNAQAYLDDMVGREARSLQEVERGAFGLFLNGSDPETAVRRLMSDGTPPGELAGFVRTLRHDPQAMAGLRRSVLERGVPELRPDFYADQLGDINRIPWPKVKNFINENRTKLEVIYSPAQLKVIEQVADDLQMANVSQAGGRVAGSNTIQNLSTANLIARLTAGGVNPTEGGRGLVGNTLGSLGRFVSWAYKMPEQQVQQLLVDAMLDPQLAQRLARRPSPTGLKELSKMLADRGLVTLSVEGTAVTGDAAALNNQSALPAR